MRRTWGSIRRAAEVPVISATAPKPIVPPGAQYYDGGRSWVTTFGHEVQAWIGDQRFLGHLTGGVKSAMGMTPFCR
ncbi:ThuA domain-containing protein [Nonomuraea sp. NEAU-A123]|uniref:ThuA domain-containing protein n=1 Tax=Nonomuraea sp. NEAU-A123 TaxID=2839649 RepID=UPI001BE3ECE3|nr:ThuA domain-containing protein [Nonomuraea sp. NEAU-A123]MBT2225540.1 hypothetical protein [Nonomuraea sp. NEAU-A123]